MGYYAIGIGGTGSKCLESLIHLAAAGMMPNNDNLYMLFVDPDKANGSLTRAKATLTHYKDFSTEPRLAQTSLLTAQIISAEDPVWNPFTKDAANPKLEDFFRYATLSAEKNPAADLFEVLYSKNERKTPLGQGFRGHPSIGASVMAQTVLEKGEPWKTFRSLVKTDTNAKVFLVGSIFGGTGASGFPTIAQLVKDEFKGKTVKIGGALALPYFTFNTDDDEGLKAKSEHFLMNTQAALKYYHLWNKHFIYDAIYLIGDQSQFRADYALGGKNQENTPHFIELYAALAAVDFFGKDGFAPDGAPQYFRIDRVRKQLQWTDLPDNNNGNEIKKIEHLSRFAFAYLSIYHPMLEDIRKSGSGHRAPWYIDFFKREGIRLNDDTKKQLEKVQNYCKDFLLWLANIQNSAEDPQFGLVKHTAYTQQGNGNRLELRSVDSFDLKKFGNLTSSNTVEFLRSVNKLWENMCRTKGKSDGTGDIGSFLSALYRNCKEI